MTLAVLCSGQGPQHPGMFDLFGNSAEAQALFAHAAALLGGIDPRELVACGTDADLHRNRTGQILCTVQALAADATLRDAWPTRRVIAGYSVGEVAAWGIAGLVNGQSILDLVGRRAESMDAHTTLGDGLLFIRGLSLEAINELCRRHGCDVAIVNPERAYVVGGSRSALEAFAKEAEAQGAAHIVWLSVSVASHTPRLAAASAEFRVALGSISVQPTLRVGVRLLSGVDGAAVIDIRTGLDKLAAQISHTVRWADCLQACVEAGATAFLELGPGRALSEMAAHAYPGVPARSLDDFTTSRGARDWLARVVD